ncbi:MAG: helix-turn-helix domain-containing protein [Mucilaginibacter sp.]
MSVFGNSELPLKVLVSVLCILYAIAVFQALLLAFYLFFQKKGVAQSRTVLASLMIDFSIFLTGTFILLFFRNWHYLYYAHLANLTVFLAAPLLYFYYRSLVIENFKVTYRSLIHAIPFVVVFSFMFFLMVFQPNHDLVFRPFGIALISALFVQSIFYLYRMTIERNAASAKGNLDVKLKWFSYLFGGIFLIFAFKLTIFIIWNVLGFIDVCIYLTGLFFIFSFILINMLILYGLFKPELLINYFKYQSSSLNDNLKSKHYNDLLALLDQKKLYLDPLLTVEKLARSLNISDKKLSQVINENAGTNFNDFINGYRIQEAKTLIKNVNEQPANILQIAYEVGFNSKSTFNTAFKKFTSSTPSAYRKRGM